MIKSDIVAKLVTFNHRDLERIALASGYRDCEFLSANFVGITNSGSFCYSITYPGDDKRPESGKVFVKYLPEAASYELEF